MKVKNLNISFFLIGLIIFFIIPNTEGATTISIVTKGVNDDAFVYEGDPTENFGNESIFKYGFEQILRLSSNLKYETYLKFNLKFGVETPYKAELSLYLKGYNNNVIEVRISEVKGDWNESSISWKNRPNYGVPKYKFNISSEGYVNYKIDIISLLKNTSISLCLYTEKGYGSGLSKEYSEKNLTDAPHLTLFYRIQDTSEDNLSIPFFNIYLFFLMLGIIIVMIRIKYSKHLQKI